MQQRRIPLRQCGGCGEMKPKSELVRVVSSPEGEISLDLKRKKNGRGSYICRSVNCFNMAIKRKSFERAFGQKLSGEAVAAVEKELKDNE